MMLPSYKKRRNTSIIHFSPQFKQAVRAARHDLGLPSEGFGSVKKRAEWYKIHFIKHTAEPYEPLPRYYWHFPKEFVGLIESWAFSPKSSKVNYYPNVPLDQCAMRLIEEFSLLEENVDEVKAYILGDEEVLSVGTAIQSILIPLDEGTKYMVLVAGISKESTKKDWLEVWKNVENILRLSGIQQVAHKRPVDSLLIRDLVFWKQIREGKQAHEVADEWIKKHPEEKDYPVEDMIRKAVERIEKIMRPDS